MTTQDLIRDTDLFLQKIDRTNLGIAVNTLKNMLNKADEESKVLDLAIAIRSLEIILKEHL